MVWLNRETLSFSWRFGDTPFKNYHLVAVNNVTAEWSNNPDKYGFFFFFSTTAQLLIVNPECIIQKILLTCVCHLTEGQQLIVVLVGHFYVNYSLPTFLQLYQLHV